MRFISVIFLMVGLVVQVPQKVLAEAAQGGPGKMGTWSRPDKSAFGTTLRRPLWFTMVDGTLSEIMYPHIDRAQIRDSFLMIKNGNSVVDERKDLVSHVERVHESLAYTITSTNNDMRIEKQVAVVPDTDAIVVDYNIRFSQPGARQLIYIHNPSAENTSGGDSINVQFDSRGEPVLSAFQGDVRGDESSLLRPWSYQLVSMSLSGAKGSVGFEGVNAPEDSMSKDRSLPEYTSALFGNVQGALSVSTTAADVRFRIVIAFTTQEKGEALHKASSQLLTRPFENILSASQSEWHSYLKKLKFDRTDKLAESSILVVKGLEDKWNKGALIAAPAIPWIPWHVESPENDYEPSRLRLGDANAGYRRVWPRDLYHKALSLLAVGDTETPVDIALWLKRVQLKGWKNGTWSQNMWTDGTPSWQGFQIDETAFPIVLVSRLAEQGLIHYPEFQDMVVRAADSIVVMGPGTDQERWEENRGLSPNSLGAAVQGLNAAAWLESIAGDVARATRYRAKANEWTDNLKKWTLIPDGRLGQNYFARMEIGGVAGWDPSVHEMIFIHNKAPGEPAYFHEDEILDGGFLEWIIAGLVNPMDSDFSRTLDLYDQTLQRPAHYTNGNTATGYIRYTFDAYGENSVGGCWPLLSAERALAALERGEDVSPYLESVLKSRSSGDLIPEQDTLSVQPLGWSHAAYLILRRSLADGRSFYIPRRSLK